jgi:diguanylate cyclase (GGDEF)-like protein
MKSKLKNLLHSGYTFDSEEYELKLKYVLFNSLLIFNVSIVFVAIFIRFLHEQYIHAIADCVYVFFGTVIFFMARRSKKYFNTLIYIIIFISYLVVAVVFHNELNPIIGQSWYIILIMSVFFLTSAKEGVFIFVLSTFTIIYTSYTKYHSSLSEILLGLIPFVASLLFMLYFEKRNSSFRKRIEKEKNKFIHQAQYDNLTNIVNRKVFLDNLHQALEEAKKTQEKVAIFFIDLDHFKEINDTFGHHVGDIVLKEVARRLKKHIRKTDTVARLGGDEYAILLQGFSDKNILKHTIDKFFSAMKEPIKADDKEIFITLSLGVAISDENSLEAKTLLKNADKAMYEAKKEGRDGYFFYKD